MDNPEKKETKEEVKDAIIVGLTDEDMKKVFGGVSFGFYDRGKKKNKTSNSQESV